MGYTRTADRAPRGDSPACVYVHLCSGETQRIEGVTGITITDLEVRFARGEDEAVVYRRRDVFYTSREPGETPLPT